MSFNDPYERYVMIATAVELANSLSTSLPFLHNTNSLCQQCMPRHLADHNKGNRFHTPLQLVHIDNASPIRFRVSYFVGELSLVD